MNSTFTNLNAYTNITALAFYQGITPNYLVDSILPLQIPMTINKGIVLNNEDF